MSGGEHLSLLGGRVPAWAQLRVVSIEPGCRRAYDPAEWRGALVVVERGEIELECVSGGSRSFGEGAVIFLADLPLRALWNTGPAPLVLTALTKAGVASDELSSSGSPF